jgi:hypothetical protein
MYAVSTMLTLELPGKEVEAANANACFADGAQEDLVKGVFHGINNCQGFLDIAGP